MKRDITLFLTASLFLTGLPGCARLIDWGKKSVDQGKNIKKETKKAQEHVRSTRVYDQFTLIGGFDSLWLADPVREAYAELYALKHGRSQEDNKVFLRRHLEENNHFISFYVLSVADIVIGEKDSKWTVFLKIGENHFVPTEFKTVELAPEYEAIFGKKFNRFKVAYLMRFNAKDIEDVYLMQPDTQEIGLVFRSVKKEVAHTWRIDQRGMLLPEVAA